MKFRSSGFMIVFLVLVLTAPHFYPYFGKPFLNDDNCVPATHNKKNSGKIYTDSKLIYYEAER